MKLDLERAMERIGMSENVRARIRRLNPNPQEGCMLRGWHPSGRRGRDYSRDEMNKGLFLRKYGRQMFERLPKQAVRKVGRRAFVRGRYVSELEFLSR